MIVRVLRCLAVDGVACAGHGSPGGAVKEPTRAFVRAPTRSVTGFLTIALEDGSFLRSQGGTAAREPPPLCPRGSRRLWDYYVRSRVSVGGACCAPNDRGRTPRRHRPGLDALAPRRMRAGRGAKYTSPDVSLREQRVLLRSSSTRQRAYAISHTATGPCERGGEFGRVC